MRKNAAFLPIAEAAPHVARIIQPIVLAHGTAPEQIQGYCANILKWAMRDLERFVRPVASRAALEKGEALGIGDIRNFVWLRQTRAMKDAKREIFHWEHIWPVSDLVKACLKCPDGDLDAIQAIISKARVAWILKEENRRLKKYDRGPDPLEYYRHAGIELVGL